MNISPATIAPSGLQQAIQGAIHWPQGRDMALTNQADSFESALAESAHQAGSSTEQLREAASRLVASALVLPAMEGLQHSALRPQSGPFAASSVEKRFSPLLHTHFADRVTLASNLNLVNTIERVFQSRGERASC